MYSDCSSSPRPIPLMTFYGIREDYMLRIAKNVVVVAVRADDHVRLGHGKVVVPWIEGVVAVARHWHLLEIHA